MELVNIRIGPVTFDHADYDADNDVLYLHVGQPQEAEGEVTPEGHVLRYAPGSQAVRQLREKRGLTQERLDQNADVTTGTVSLLERG